jgi:hypothetical protein
MGRRLAAASAKNERLIAVAPVSKQILTGRSANMPPLLFWEKGHMRTYQAGSGDREMYESAIFQAERKKRAPP